MRILTLLTLLLFGCGHAKHGNENATIVSATKEDSVAEKVISDKPVLQTDTLPKPTAYFLSFTGYLDSIGYIADTARACKISDGELSNVVWDGGKPFFSVLPARHSIQTEKGFVESYHRSDHVVIDFSVFLKPVSILAYYYRKNIKSSLIEDGVIEEWNFKTDDDAKAALQELNKMKGVLYFNTASFCMRGSHYLYIFHTRASAFDITLEKIYRAFKRKRAEQLSALEP